MEDWTGYVYVMKDNGYKYKVGCLAEPCKNLQQIHRQPGNRDVTLIATFEAKKMTLAETLAQNYVRSLFGMKTNATQTGFISLVM